MAPEDATTELERASALPFGERVSHDKREVRDEAWREVFQNVRERRRSRRVLRASMVASSG